MIRAICLMLVTANIAYFAWHSWIVPPQAPTPAPPEGSARLLLAREAPATAAPAGPQDDTRSSPSKCLSIGPFVDLTDTVKTAASLRQKGLSPRHRAVEGAVWAGYWVALEGIAGVKDADATITRLRKAGIADSYIMPSIEGEGVTVSLGLFTERRRAMTRVDEVRALGFEPKVSPRQRSGTVYWIDVDYGGSADQLDLSSSDSDAGRIVRLKVKPCEAAVAGEEPAASTSAANGAASN